MTSRPGIQAARQLVCTALAVATLSACAGAIRSGPSDIPALEQTVQKSASASNLSQLGIAYYNGKRFDEARNTLQKAVAAGAKDGNTALYLGLANEEIGDYTAARVGYERYMASNSGSASFRKNIQGRIALVSRQELKQQAKVALQREQELATEAPTPRSIAVLPFRLVGISDEMQPLQTALAEMIVTDIGFTGLRSIERVRVQSMLDEMRLTHGGVTSEETGARTGRLLRAERVVQGQLTGTGGEALSVDAVVLNTAERTPGDPVTRQGQLQGIFDLEKQVVFGILDAAKYPLTAAERDRINQNRATSLLAFLAYGRGLEALDRGDYDQANAQFRQATQMDPGFGAAKVQTTEAAQLNTAAQTSTADIAVQAPAVEAPNTSLQRNIAADLNPSPAQSVVTTTTETNSTTTPTQQTGNERAAPTTEATQAPQISQAKKATVIIKVDNPTIGHLRALTLFGWGGF
jgi:tetratricopeptide (TPR) repeat protein